MQEGIGLAAAHVHESPKVGDAGDLPPHDGVVIQVVDGQRVAPVRALGRREHFQLGEACGVESKGTQRKVGMK